MSPRPGSTRALPDDLALEPAERRGRRRRPAGRRSGNVPAMPGRRRAICPRYSVADLLDLAAAGDDGEQDLRVADRGEHGIARGVERSRAMDVHPSRLTRPMVVVVNLATEPRRSVPREADMIERHITFNVHPDKTGAFERFFADDYRPAMATSPGFVRADLLREADSPTRYQMVLRFEDARQRRRLADVRGPPALQPDADRAVRRQRDPGLRGDRLSRWAAPRAPARAPKIGRRSAGRPASRSGGVMTLNLNGLIPATVLPMHADGSIDEAALALLHRLDRRPGTRGAGDQRRHRRGSPPHPRREGARPAGRPRDDRPADRRRSGRAVDRRRGPPGDRLQGGRRRRAAGLPDPRLPERAARRRGSRSATTRRSPRSGCR